MKPDLSRASVWLTSLGVGLLPGPTGTYGSLVTVLAAMGWVHGWQAPLQGYGFLGLVAVVTLVALAATHRALSLRVYGASQDPGQVVADEVAGQLIAMYGIQSVGWEMIAAFFLFRFFDIFKPFPVGWSQSLPGAWGVVVDDLLAGIYSLITLRLMVYCFFTW